MIKRVNFCESFFIFWNSAKFLKSNVKIIKTHMDEKWVDGIVTRTNIEILEFYSIDRRHIYDRHKNYVDQFMFIVLQWIYPKRK